MILVVALLVVRRELLRATGSPLCDPALADPAVADAVLQAALVDAPLGEPAAGRPSVEGSVDTRALDFPP